MTIPGAETTIAIVNLFGAANGLLLAVVLVLLHEPTRPTRYLGLVLLCASLTLALITLEHRAWIPRHWVVYAAEEWLSLLVGPLLVAFVRRALAGDHPPAWIYLPPLAYPVLIVLMPGERRFVGMEYVMWIQIAYTIGAARVFLRLTRDRERTRGTPASVGFVIAVAFLIHAAQVARIVAGEAPIWREIVPITGTVLFYALLVYALLQSRVLKLIGGIHHAVDDRQRALFFRLDEQVREDGLYLDPKLDLATLARTVDLPPHQVSEAINRAAGKSFYDYLAELRISEAKRLLADPDEQRYTIEGIARQCGFRSRSAFYRLFKEATGLTPAQWREERLGSG